MLLGLDDRVRLRADLDSDIHLREQDCGTLAAIDAFLDPTMVSDANVGRGLITTVIPLSRTVNYRAVGGMMRPVTFARAMAAKNLVARLPIPAGILRIPVFSVPVALFSQESQFLFRRNIILSPSEILSVWGQHRRLCRK